MNARSTIQRTGLVTIYGLPGLGAIMLGLGLSGDAGWIVIPFWFWGSFVAAGALGVTACLATSTRLQWATRIMMILLLLVLLGGMTKNVSWATWSTASAVGFLIATAAGAGLFVWFAHHRNQPLHWAVMFAWGAITVLWVGLSWPFKRDPDWSDWLHPSDLTWAVPALLLIFAWLATPGMLSARLLPRKSA